ncbi:MAG TPA: hypothetical protein PLJ45_05250 [Sphingorhabdus sp.]|nr:hypothetical protein [Sphingorhabdus sp.]HQS12672.1 hypothetical protein [Sphingorhabdus sp.]HQS79678.1 hypothetical protein [Sphingorhabdus sp.]
MRSPIKGTASAAPLAHAAVPVKLFPLLVANAEAKAVGIKEEAYDQ